MRALNRCTRWFFDHLYHDFAWTYDVVACAVSLGHWYRWVESIIPLVEGPCILEIGFGTGHVLQALSRAQGRQVVGIDESPQMVGLAKGRIQAMGAPPPHIVRGMSQRLPMVNSSFDSVVSTFPAGFIFDPKTIAEIQRVLKPAGRLILLPVVRVVGERWFEKAAAWILAATGETPPGAEALVRAKLGPCLDAAGFDYAIRQLKVSAGCLLVVTATK